MKHATKNLVIPCGLALLVLSSQAAIVNPFSSDAYASNDPNWITNTAQDIDGDGLGSDGYYFFGTLAGTVNGQAVTSTVANDLPAYASISFGANALSIADNPNTGFIDDPRLIGTPMEGDNTQSGTLVARNPGGNAGNPAFAFVNDVFSVTITGLVSDQTVRLGILAGNEGTNDGRWDPTSIRLTDASDGSFVQIGAGATGGPNFPVGDPGAGEQTANVNWVFFDIDADGTYEVGGNKRGAGGNQALSFGGITLDSITIPEPSSVLLLGLSSCLLQSSWPWPDSKNLDSFKMSLLSKIQGVTRA